MSEKQLSVEERNKRTLKKLLIWAVAMFGFAFLMVPFYNVICDITGLNGKTSSTAATDVPEQVVADRTVTVEFITQKGDGISGEFTSETKRVKVHPGEITLVHFHVLTLSCGQSLLVEAEALGLAQVARSFPRCYGRNALGNHVL